MCEYKFLFASQDTLILSHNIPYLFSGDNIATYVNVKLPFDRKILILNSHKQNVTRKIRIRKEKL